jgi:hypothetical protein
MRGHGIQGARRDEVTPHENVANHLIRSPRKPGRLKSRSAGSAGGASSRSYDDEEPFSAASIRSSGLSS